MVDPSMLADAITTSCAFFPAARADMNSATSSSFSLFPYKIKHPKSEKKKTVRKTFFSQNLRIL
jgi:hypothetical protein